jgi:hypothetical protein
MTMGDIEWSKEYTMIQDRIENFCAIIKESREI